jgi:hypothetical protein
MPELQRKSRGVMSLSYNYLVLHVLQNIRNGKRSPGAAVKLLPWDHEVMGSSPGNSPLHKCRERLHQRLSTTRNSKFFPTIGCTSNYQDFTESFISQPFFGELLPLLVTCNDANVTSELNKNPFKQV